MNDLKVTYNYDLSSITDSTELQTINLVSSDNNSVIGIEPYDDTHFIITYEYQGTDSILPSILKFTSDVSNSTILTLNVLANNILSTLFISIVVPKPELNGRLLEVSYINKYKRSMRRYDTSITSFTPHHNYVDKNSIPSDGSISPVNPYINTKTLVEIARPAAKSTNTNSTFDWNSIDTPIQSGDIMNRISVAGSTYNINVGDNKILHESKANNEGSIKTLYDSSDTIIGKDNRIELDNRYLDSYIYDNLDSSLPMSVSNMDSLDENIEMPLGYTDLDLINKLELDGSIDIITYDGSDIYLGEATNSHTYLLYLVIPDSVASSINQNIFISDNTSAILALINSNNSVNINLSLTDSSGTSTDTKSMSKGQVEMLIINSEVTT